MNHKGSINQRDDPHGTQARAVGCRRGIVAEEPYARGLLPEKASTASVSQILPHTARVPYGRRRGARPVKGGVLSVSQNNDSVILTCSVILSVSLFYKLTS